MKVTSEPLADRQVLLQVETEPQEMEKSLEAAYRRLARRLSIPGFRRGRAPRSLVETYVGREALVEEALGEAVAQAYEQALKEKEIEPMAGPKIEVLSRDPVAFKAVVPLVPVVELGDYKALRLPLEVAPTTEEGVDQALEELRQQNSPWEPAERPVAAGDRVSLEVVGRVEGKEVLNQKGVEMVVELDRPFPLPGFAPELLGLEKGGEKEFTLPFPADHPNPDLQGKEGVFRVKVLGVKERKYKPLEALVQEAGVADLAALRERVKTGLEARARAEAKRGLEEQALEALVAGARLEFPPVLVEQQIDRLLRERGIKEAGEKAREETRPVAQRQVLRGLALRKLAEVEGIKVEDREIDSEIEKMAQGRAEVKRFFASPAAHQSLRDALVLGKARERLGARASGEKEAGEKQEGGKEDASAT